MLQVRLLGDYSIVANDRPIEIASRPAQLLFAYLILHAGTPQPREQLASLFWPDSTAENARSNLRHALWQLRQALGATECCLVADDFTITFSDATECHIDVAELEREPSTLRSTEQLKASLAVYVGDLLPGIYEPWVVLERERLQAVFEHKMDLLLEQLVAQQRWPAVVECAERWIALGESPEAAYRALMLAHARLGHTSRLHAAYQRCREALASNLGLEPSAETEELYAQLTRTRGVVGRLEAPASTAAVAATGDREAMQRQVAAARALADRERQVAEAHRLAATRATRLAAGLALALAGVIGAWLHGRRRR